jgi:S-methylmethionine-dependent homocysteine/selenocysteine methylase
MEAEAIIEAMSTFADAICWISFACKVGIFIVAKCYLLHEMFRITFICVMERLL